jgi:guanyl-specific ribonuclease Sa
MSDRIQKLVSTILVAVLAWAPVAQGYEYLRSNPINRTDPTGLFSTTDLLTAQSWCAYLRTTGTLAGIGVGIAGVYGGFRSGFEAQLNGASSREIAIAAVKGAGYTGYNAFARVLLPSAIISTGPGGLALAGGIGVYEAADAYGDARARQEQATTQAELDLATFDSVFASLAVGGSLYATSAGIRGAAIAAQGMPIPPRAYAVLQHVRQKGSPMQGFKGGRVFRNDEGRLPANGRYREYDIDPQPPPGVGRNMERIIIDEASGNAWYSPEHYVTFKPM